MKRACMAAAAARAGILLLAMVASGVSQAKTLGVGTGTHWTVTDAAGNDLGNAQNVCRFPGAPEGCPSGATLMGSSNWIAIPGANWIWVPNVTGTSPASVNAEFTFKTIAFLCGQPTAGTITVAADNTAEVFVNRDPNANPPAQPLATITSFAAASTVTIPTAKLAQGINIIEVKVRNATSPPNCNQYQCNPAGVVLKASISDNLPSWPTCKGQGNKDFEVGQFEDQACSPGQVGSKSHVCVCVFGAGIWWDGSNTCTTPPVTCTGSNNTTFMVGAQEPRACPAGKTGNAFRTCQANGQWSADNTNGCTLPNVGIGDLCGAVDKGITANCPAGSSCVHRALPTPPRDAWCAIFGINCPTKLWSADWFCTPD